MCRLAFITERFPGQKEWLLQLEKSMGGDGNGIAIGKTVVKGVNLTIDKIDGLITNSTSPVLFHTRRVSSGVKSDDLCHPFPCRKGFLAHNGHWHDGHNAACVLDDLRVFKSFSSDSQVFSFLVDKIGFERAVTRYKPDGVWLFVNKKGKLFVYKNSGTLYYSPEWDAWGSEKADGGYWYAVEDDYYTPGDTPKEATWSKNFYGGYSPKKSKYSTSNSDYRSTPVIPPFRPAEDRQEGPIKVYKPPATAVFGLGHVIPSTAERKKMEEFNDRALPEYYKNLDGGHRTPSSETEFRKAGSL